MKPTVQLQAQMKQLNPTLPAVSFDFAGKPVVPSGKEVETFVNLQSKTFADLPKPGQFLHLPYKSWEKMDPDMYKKLTTKYPTDIYPYYPEVQQNTMKVIAQSQVNLNFPTTVKAQSQQQPLFHEWELQPNNEFMQWIELLQLFRETYIKYKHLEYRLPFLQFADPVIFIFNHLISWRKTIRNCLLQLITPPKSRLVIHPLILQKINDEIDLSDMIIVLNREMFKYMYWPYIDPTLKKAILDIFNDLEICVINNVILKLPPQQRMKLKQDVELEIYNRSREGMIQNL